MTLGCSKLFGSMSANQQAITHSGIVGILPEMIQPSSLSALLFMSYFPIPFRQLVLSSHFSAVLELTYE
jgi:hypothetical protein